MSGAPTSPDPPTALPGIGRELQWQSVCLLVLTVLAVGGALYFLRPVLVPFILAVFFAVGLSPILDLIERRLHAPRLTAVTIAFGFGLLVLAALGVTIGSSIDSLTHDKEYKNTAEAAVTRVADFAAAWGLLPAEAEPDADSEDNETPPAEAAPSSNTRRLGAAVGQLTAGFQEWLLGAMGSLFSTLSVVLIFMYFLLLGASGNVRPTEGPSRIIEEKLREYVLLKTVISVFTGVAVWLVLALFGVPLALVFGLLTFLLNYIPNFGPLVTCVLPLPVIWLHPELSLFGMILASVLSCGVQLVSGNVVEPKLMGDSFDLHPIVVLLALMLWGAIWGFVGMLLAVPITAAIKILLQKMERTRPIALVMGGDLSAIQFGDETQFGMRSLS